jgi:hypothetical protein
MTQKQIQLEIFDRDSKAKKESKSEGDIIQDVAEFKFPTQLYIKISALIIMVIVSFALGVERGKVISKRNISTRFIADNKSTEIGQEIPIKKATTQEEQSAKNTAKNKIAEDKTKVSDKAKTEEKTKDTKINTPGYIIQVASYKKNSSFIDKEIAKLQKNGYNTLTISGGEYIGICAGKFANREEAQKHLSQLQRIYKDCLIRKI